MYIGWDRDYQQYRHQYLDVYDEVMKSKSENVEFLETRVANLVNRKYAVAVKSATDALHFSLLCHGIGQGDEVLVSNFSWISTSSCISMVGATPVFWDIDPDTYHISIKSIEKMVLGRSGKVKALIYTHLFGNMTDSTAIQEFCQENNIIFIEDSAQSLGSSLNGIPAGSIGDCSSFSFNTNKVISGVNGGGMFLTNNEEHYEIVKSLRRCGKNKDFERLGYNSKMLLLDAKIIDFRLNRMVQLQEARQKIASQYDEAFEITHMHDNLNHNYHKYVIEVDPERREKLEGFVVHYDTPLSENSMYRKIAHRKDDCKYSKAASMCVVSLPIHPWMTQEEVQQVIQKMWSVL